MDKTIIKKIQKQIIQLLPADKQNNPDILLTDSCSEVSRLVSCWIKNLNKSSRILILKGVRVCHSSKAHDILAVTALDAQIYIIDPTIWQFFPKKKSILLFISNNVDSALKKLKTIYGGQWSISEEFIQMQKKEEQEYLNIIAQNISENLKGNF